MNALRYVLSLKQIVISKGKSYSKYSHGPHTCSGMHTHTHTQSCMKSGSTIRFPAVLWKGHFSFVNPLITLSYRLFSVKSGLRIVLDDSVVTPLLQLWWCRIVSEYEAETSSSQTHFTNNFMHIYFIKTDTFIRWLWILFSETSVNLCSPVQWLSTKTTVSQSASAHIFEWNPFCFCFFHNRLHFFPEQTKHKHPEKEFWPRQKYFRI